MLEYRVNDYLATDDEGLPHVSNKQQFTESKLSVVMPNDTESKLVTACFSIADNSDLLDALRYHLESGGNRSRACMCLNAGIALGLKDKDASILAVSAELLHNASLIQDDLQDQDKNRRGRPAVWKRYGNNVALGLVDLMIASSFKHLTNISKVDKLPQLICKLHDAISVTLQGQSLDTSTQQLPEDLNHCLMVAEKKIWPTVCISIGIAVVVGWLSGSCQTSLQSSLYFWCWLSNL